MKDQDRELLEAMLRAGRMTADEREQLESRLRENLRVHADNFAQLLDSTSDHRGYEDAIYRFYHQSLKVYRLGESTEKIVAALSSLLPDQPLNPWFLHIVRQGTGRQFKPEDNDDWLAATRPVVEAFFHARFFLEMACRYREAPPKDQLLPSGWAALLYLFNLR